MWNNENGEFDPSGDKSCLNDGGFGQNRAFAPEYGGALSEQPYDPEPSRNAFREDISVAAVVQKKHPFYIKGPMPLEGEPLYEYERRTDFEQRLIKRRATKELKGSATRLSLLMLLYTVLFLVVPSAVAVIYDRGWGAETALGQSISNFFIYIALYPVIFSLLIYLGNLGTAHSVKSFFRKPECSPEYVFRMFVLICGVTLIVSIGYGVIMDIFGISSAMTATPFTSVFDAISQFISICVFAPIFEELLFRGVYLSNHLKFGGWHACVVSALFFALFHLNHEQLPYAFLAGLFLAFVTLKSGSLIPSVIIHAGVNFVSFLQIVSISLIDNYGDMFTMVDWRPKGSLPALVFFTFMTFLPYLIMLVALVMFFVELRSNKSEFILPVGDSGLSRSEKMLAFISSPATIAAVVVMALLTVISGIAMLFTA